MEQSRFSDFVLKLINSALEFSPGEHQRTVVDLVREVVQFDAAWWGWSSFSAGRTTLVNSATFNLPGNFETTFRGVAHQDPFIRHGKNLKDYALTRETTNVSLQEEFRAFLTRFGIMATLNGHCRLQGDSGFNFFMSLYRFGEAAKFNSDETADFRLVIRHLEQSLSLSLRTELRALAPTNGEAAIVSRHGAHVRTTRNFMSNFSEEGLSSNEVMSILKELAKGRTHWSGRCLMLTGRSYASGLVLILQSRRDARSQLSATERQVADQYLSGLTMKEIAQARQVSPHTIRNQLASIYRKTDTKGKLRLARALERFP